MIKLFYKNKLYENHQADTGKKNKNKETTFWVCKVQNQKNNNNNNIDLHFFYLQKNEWPEHR